jgi:hypothetical protein
LPEQLQLYRVNQHLLICHSSPTRVIVLTVAHCKMDIASRLFKLEPTLAEEIEILSRRLESRASPPRDD